MALALASPSVRQSLLCQGLCAYARDLGTRLVCGADTAGTWATAKPREIDSQIYTPREALQLIDSMTANELCERQDHGVSLGLETQEALRLVQEGSGKIKRCTHTNDDDLYA